VKSVALEAQSKTAMTSLLKQRSCRSTNGSECITRPKHTRSVRKTLHAPSLKGCWLRGTFGLTLKSLNELLTMQLIGAEQSQSQHLVFAEIFGVGCKKLIRKNQIGISIL
jgi:hypothetical protein